MKTKPNPVRFSTLAARAALVVLLAAAATACSLTRIQRTEPDGQAFTATNARLFWKSGGVDIAYDRTGTNLSAKAKLDQTGTDVDALKAIAEGIATGTTKAATKAVVP